MSLSRPSPSLRTLGSGLRSWSSTFARAQVDSVPLCHSCRRTLTTSTRHRQTAAPAAPKAQPTNPPPRPTSNTSAAPPRFTPKPANVQSSSAPLPQTERAAAASKPASPNETRDLASGLEDEPLILDEGDRQIDWTRSFHGLSAEAFPPEAAARLLAPLNPEKDVEVKPDGIIYLPEIKYRRRLNEAFGPGAWGLAPRGETIVTGKLITREYGLVVKGRLVSVARGEQQYFDPDGIPTATEGCKSNALMRCCKDLGIASELWDPRFIRDFMKKHAKEVWVEHVVNKKKRKITIRKDDEVRYPFKEVKMGAATGAF